MQLEATATAASTQQLVGKHFNLHRYWLPNSMSL
jgi:hypothetical protein